MVAAIAMSVPRWDTEDGALLNRHQVDVVVFVVVFVAGRALTPHHDSMADPADPMFFNVL